MENKSEKEIVSIQGRNYEVLSIGSVCCCGCSFNDDVLHICVAPLSTRCTSDTRCDGRDVIFKLIENEK